MFRFISLKPDEVKRFETPYNVNFTEVHLNDTTINPSENPSWKPVHCIMPAKYREYADRIRNLTVYEDDVWVVTFLKSGTTWTQEMVWLIDHDLDYNTASAVNLTERSVFLEVVSFVTNMDVNDSMSQVEQLPRPRHIKSHLPLALLPKQLWTVKPKIVYVARNPKDVTTSLMHHYKHLHGFKGSKQDFLDGILADQIIYCPMVKHATEFWTVSRRDHVLFLHYEDMKKNLATVLLQVCKFFRKTFTPTQLAMLEQHLSFDSMKENNSANNQTLVTKMEVATSVPCDFKFMRKGQVGGYKDELPAEFVSKLDELVRDQLRGTGFEYKE